VERAPCARACTAKGAASGPRVASGLLASGNGLGHRAVVSEPNGLGPGLCLITGASSGIGAAYARRLARDGHDVVLVARRTDRLQELGRELSACYGVRAEPWTADLSGHEGIAEVRRRVLGEPPLAALVHAAGFGSRALFADMTPALALGMNQLHVIAATELVHAALPSMLAQGRGLITLVSSLSAFFTTARYVTYSASKAYLNAFAEGLAAELAGTGVRVQAVCAGLTRTEFLDTPEYQGFRYQQVPQWAWMSPEQVVDESLASTETIFVPGSGNRAFVRAMKAPLLGPALNWALGRLNRNGLY
jgi:uncharacterized protein